MPEALDYAAKGRTGFNYYSGKGELLETLPYARLRKEALQVAKILLGTGLQPGDRVALFAESDGDFARIFFGCQYAGLVPAPLPLPVAFGGRAGYIETVRGMIRSAAVRAVVIPQVIQSWSGEILENLDLAFGGSPQELLERKKKVRSLPKISGDALSYIQFSSGSTRFPMGVAVTQKAVMANTMAISKFGLKLVAGDRANSWLPLYHDMGLVGFFLTPLVSQFSVDFLPTREFARRPFIWLELIDRNKSSVAYSPSFGYELCSKRPPREGLDLSSWRVAGIGGDMIRPHILEEFAEVFAPAGFDPRAFVASYGMAETTLALSFAPLSTGVKTDKVSLESLECSNQALPPKSRKKTATREFVLCGPPLPEHYIEVRSDTGEILPERAVGRIFAKGPSLLKEYFRRPLETQAVLSKEGWLDTGDLGYFLNGQIVITGRIKDLILVNGRNIWPQDLEWTVEHEIPSLRSRDVAVFSMEGSRGDEIVALVQCRLGEKENRDVLRSEITSLLRRSHGIEVKTVLVPPRSLPQTSSGKLTRAKARAMYLNGEFETPVS